MARRTPDATEPGWIHGPTGLCCARGVPVPGLSIDGEQAPGPAQCWTAGESVRDVVRKTGADRVPWNRRYGGLLP